ncbi:MAG: hypothetical protein WDO14_07060 [Bacteroidota bacterium]
MIPAEEIDKINRIGETDVKDLAAILLHSLSIKKDNPVESLKHQDSILNKLISFLEKCLDENLLNNQDKLLVVKVLDKLNLQKELIELKLQGQSIENLKIAAERLGKKSQSAFGGD